MLESLHCSSVPKLWNSPFKLIFNVPAIWVWTELLSQPKLDCKMPLLGLRPGWLLDRMMQSVLTDRFSWYHSKKKGGGGGGVDSNLISSFSYLVVILTLFPQKILTASQDSKQILILVATVCRDWKEREEREESLIISFKNVVEKLVVLCYSLFNILDIKKSSIAN